MCSIQIEYTLGNHFKITDFFPLSNTQQYFLKNTPGNISLVQENADFSQLS